MVGTGRVRGAYVVEFAEGAVFAFWWGRRWDEAAELGREGGKVQGGFLRRFFGGLGV